MLRFLSTFLLLAAASFFTVVSNVFANGRDVHEEVEEAAVPTLEEIIRSNSIKVVFFASIIVIIGVILTILLKNTSEGVKRVLFSLIVVPIIATTLFITGSTLYLNFQSSSGGPVHWHAQYEIWDCGQKLELADPERFSNKVGTATLHEHNDDWIHLEGVVVDSNEASLGTFFKAVGGEITDDSFKFPSDSGLVNRHDGDLCPDGLEGTLQVFVYQTEGKVFTQKKLDEPAIYILSSEGNIPPGDCIIIEFDTTDKEKTEKLCEQYELQVLKGNLYGN